MNFGEFLIFWGRGAATEVPKQARDIMAGAAGFAALGLVLLAPSAQGITLWHAGNVPAFTPSLPGRASMPRPTRFLKVPVCGNEIDKVGTQHSRRCRI